MDSAVAAVATAVVAPGMEKHAAVGSEAANWGVVELGAKHELTLAMNFELFFS